ncbi:MAG TPA: autotransporter domain-containing protein [Hellea balneolensis]|uniref:Autotransporter domain-containing protein n=1 Tax=Hellea balneolensis TaxID=287478 RepID=A0A7C3C3H6_9PROT|nr:autotransporter domain-containing protein [Hellea balneolensis]
MDNAQVNDFSCSEAEGQDCTTVETLCTFPSEQPDCVDVSGAAPNNGQAPSTGTHSGTPERRIHCSLAALDREYRDGLRQQFEDQDEEAGFLYYLDENGDLHRTVRIPGPEGFYYYLDLGDATSGNESQRRRFMVTYETLDYRELGEVEEFSLGEVAGAFSEEYINHEREAVSAANRNGLADIFGNSSGIQNTESARTPHSDYEDVEASDAAIIKDLREVKELILKDQEEGGRKRREEREKNKNKGTNTTSSSEPGIITNPTAANLSIVYKDFKNLLGFHRIWKLLSKAGETHLYKQDNKIKRAIVYENDEVLLVDEEPQQQGDNMIVVYNIKTGERTSVPETEKHRQAILSAAAMQMDNAPDLSGESGSDGQIRKINSDPACTSENDTSNTCVEELGFDADGYPIFPNNLPEGPPVDISLRACSNVDRLGIGNFNSGGEKGISTDSKCLSIPSGLTPFANLSELSYFFDDDEQRDGYENDKFKHYFIYYMDNGKIKRALRTNNYSLWLVDEVNEEGFVTVVTDLYEAKTQVLPETAEQRAVYLKAAAYEVSNVPDQPASGGGNNAAEPNIKFESDPDQDGGKRTYGKNLPYPAFNMAPGRATPFKPVTGSVKAAGASEDGVFGLLAGSFTSANLTDANVSLKGGSKTRPWKIFLKGESHGLNDSRTGLDRRAEQYKIDVGVLKRVSARTTLGAQLSVKDGDVKSRSLNARLDSTYYGVSGFVRHRMSRRTVFSGMVGYQRGDNDLDLNGANGTYNSKVLSGSARLQTTMRLGKGKNKGSFNPDIRFTAHRLKNDGFTLSNGEMSLSKNITITNFALGGDFRHVLISDEAKARGEGPVRTRIGLHLVHTAHSGVLNLSNGILDADEIGFGARVNGGISKDMKDGVRVGFRGSFSYFDDVKTYSVSGRISKKF